MCGIIIINTNLDYRSRACLPCSTMMIDTFDQHGSVANLMENAFEEMWSLRLWVGTNVASSGVTWEQ